MKRILFIAPDSYPLNGAESIVNLKLLKAMTNNGGFIIDLVSKNNKNKEYGANTLEDLGIKLNSLNIIEVDNKITIGTIWSHFMCLLKFGIVFKGSHWSYEALGVVEKLVKENEYDYILTKNLGAPLIGAYLKRKYGIKWVATWNDPYPDALYPEVYANVLGAKYNSTSKAIIKMIHKYTDINIFPSFRLRDHLNQYYKLDLSKTIIIPHVVNNDTSMQKNEDNSVLSIIHSGRLSYPREADKFLLGLRMFLDYRHDACIRVDFLGTIDEATKQLVKDLNLTDYVNILPPISYKDSLSLTKKYSVALIIEAKCKGIFLPTKVSDFMQVGIPIFTVSPQNGVLNDLFTNKSIGYFADNNDENSVCNCLKKLYSDYEKHTIVQNKIPLSYTEKSVVELYKKI